jgi:hypothetical protein
MDTNTTIETWKQPVHLAMAWEAGPMLLLLLPRTDTPNTKMAGEKSRDID